MLALSVRLTFAASDVVAARLFVFATSAGLVGHLVNLAPKLVGGLSRVAVCCWIASQAALVAATFHPSRRRLARPADVEPGLLGARLGVLGVALAGIPVSTVFLAGSQRVVPVVGTVAVTGLVLWRLGRSLHERERRTGQQVVMLRLGQLAVGADRHALFTAAVEAAARITAASAAAGLEIGGREPGLVARAGAWPETSPPPRNALEEVAVAASAVQAAGPATFVLREQVLTVVPFGPPGVPHGLVAVAGAVEVDLATLYGVAQILGSGVRRLRAEVGADGTRRQVAVSASIGVVVSTPAEVTDVDRLLREADELMYEVKRAGRNGYRISAATVDVPG